MNPTDITQYIDIANRRIWSIIIPFLLILLAGLFYVLNTPKIYEAQTLILVQSQRVPQDFVRTIVSTTVEDRLRTITQQVTSRTNLEKIISEYHLFENSPATMSIDYKVMSTRKRIKIDVTTGGRARETNAFTISFRDKYPRTVMDVTNALASNFITENLKIRESQALGTTSFLKNELLSAEKRLMEKEEGLKIYRERYMGGLPEQLETNLSILERLQAQQDQLSTNLRDAESRNIILQRQIAEHQSSGPVLTANSGTDGQGARDIGSLRNELATLESRYTQNHPDVIRIKNMIAKFEAQRSGNGTESTEGGAPLSEVERTMRQQQNNVVQEIKNLKTEVKKTHTEIKGYQLKVEETPKREQELLSLRRDYENLQELYNSLLARKLEAEIAVSMEKKQKGEQFRVVDPAKIPSNPVEPDVKKIILLTLAIGLGLGGGLAFLKENMDTSFKTPNDLEEELQLPVLVRLPIQKTEKELKSIKYKNILAYTATGLAFILSAIAIVIASKGIDNTMEFVQKLLSGT